MSVCVFMFNHKENSRRWAQYALADLNLIETNHFNLSRQARRSDVEQCTRVHARALVLRRQDEYISTVQTKDRRERGSSAQRGYYQINNNNVHDTKWMRHQRGNRTNLGFFVIYDIIGIRMLPYSPLWHRPATQREQWLEDEVNVSGAKTTWTDLVW